MANPIVNSLNFYHRLAFITLDRPKQWKDNLVKSKKGYWPDLNIFSDAFNNRVVQTSFRIYEKSFSGKNPSTIESVERVYKREIFNFQDSSKLGRVHRVQFNRGLFTFSGNDNLSLFSDLHFFIERKVPIPGMQKLNDPNAIALNVLRNKLRMNGPTAKSQGKEALKKDKIIECINVVMIRITTYKITENQIQEEAKKENIKLPPLFQILKKFNETIKFYNMFLAIEIEIAERFLADVAEGTFDSIRNDLGEVAGKIVNDKGEIVVIEKDDERRISIINTIADTYANVIFLKNFTTSEKFKIPRAKAFIEVAGNVHDPTIKNIVSFVSGYFSDNKIKEIKELCSQLRTITQKIIEKKKEDKKEEERKEGERPDVDCIDSNAFSADSISNLVPKGSPVEEGFLMDKNFRNNFNSLESSISTILSQIARANIDVEASGRRSLLLFFVPKGEDKISDPKENPVFQDFFINGSRQGMENISAGRRNLLRALFLGQRAQDLNNRILECFDIAFSNDGFFMFIGPASIDYRFPKLISKQFTKRGAIFQHWGEDVPTITIAGTTGNVMVLESQRKEGLLFNKEGGGFALIPEQQATNTRTFANQEIFSFNDRNIAMNLQNSIISSSETVKRQVNLNSFLNLIRLYRNNPYRFDKIYMFYRAFDSKSGKLYYGHLRDLTIKQSSERPRLLTYSMTLVVEFESNSSVI